MVNYNELRDGQEFYANGYKAGYKQAILDGKTQYQRPLDEWIPVSERLPEKAGEYLCTLHYAIPPYHMLHPEKDVYVDDVRVNKFDGIAFVSSVIAWKPLPEAYKEEEK